ncbi:hypothetical protein JZO73_12965 [Enterococcus plantarum]|uniref:hypothetical protein n=1 Tax=Enterococcus plantarum TaxID=1077675 RepID=UPI001A908423|nr:hypothetical protein [Enterococcus plantarum]MBO0468440.1 hypothetical protein [Enterococcus plantarum]
MSKKISMKQIKDFIMNEANEHDMRDIVELMRARKASMDLEKLAQEKKKIIDSVKHI